MNSFQTTPGQASLSPRLSSRAPRVGVFLELNTSFGRRVLEGVAAYARGGWEILTESWGDISLADLERGDDMVDGLIAAVRDTRTEAALRSSGRPFVNVVQSGLAPEEPGVWTDPEEVGRQAADHLMELGLGNLAMLGERGRAWSSSMQKAFLKEVEGRGGQGFVHETPVSWAGHRMRETRSLTRWLQFLPRPAGLFVVNDIPARRVLQLCRESQIRVPEDMAVLGFGDYDLVTRLAVPPLSSVIQPAGQIGYEAAQVLDGLLKGEPVPATPVLVPPSGIMARHSSQTLAVKDGTVSEALRFIQAHLEKGLNVSDVASHVAVSRRWLELRFRQVLGRSPATQIRRAQLQKARLLLMETDWPLKRISQECGLSSPERLHVLFRRELRVSPGAFRERFRRATLSPG